jgi:phosphonate transport system substrate-binding protein
MIRKLSGLILLVALFCAQTVTAATTEINFGIISTEATMNLKKDWEPFLAEMEKATGLKINAFFASDYAGIIEGMRFNKVQVAWYGNKSAMEAVDRADGEIFAQTVPADGTPGYYSHLIAHKDSPLNSLEDVLKNAGSLAFGNGDPNSTSGFLVPGYYVFAKNNVDPKKIFKNVLNANHETNALSVANKQVDVATNNSENLAKLEKSHPDKRKEIKVIWTSPLIPSDPLVWRKDLPEDVKAKIKTFIMTYGATGKDNEKAILAALGWAPFKASTNDQLLPIRQLELFKSRIKVEGDTTLSAEEKTKKLAEIDTKLEAIKAKL